MSDTPNPSFAIIWFMIITTVYFIIKYNTGNAPNKSNQTVYFGIYILLIVVGEYFINLGLTKSMCGENQWGTATIVTIIPWVVIFGILNVMLMVFPGWLSPFSNTFGYGVARLAGLNDIMNKLIKPKMSESASKETKEMQETLAHIYADKSLLINEITQENFDVFWERMRGIFIDKPDEFKNKLRDMVRLKDIVSEYIWYLLTGTLVTSVGYNYTINAGCQQSVAEMQKRHDEYEKDMQENEEAKANKKQTRIYSTFE